MAERKSIYLPVSADEELKEKVSTIAKKQRRSMAEQGRILLEMGIDRFEREEQQRREILAGQTQLDMGGFDDVEARR